jgi:hypothetical protein
MKTIYFSSAVSKIEDAISCHFNLLSVTTDILLISKELANEFSLKLLFGFSLFKNIVLI